MLLGPQQAKRVQRYDHRAALVPDDSERQRNRSQHSEHAEYTDDSNSKCEVLPYDSGGSLGMTVKPGCTLDTVFH